MYAIDRKKKTPLKTQLYRAIRDRILDGSHPAGWKLLPSRELARELGVSRLTVVEAYEQLTAEGYVNSRVGDGSYVADGVRALLLGSRGENGALSTQPEAGLPHSSRPLGYRTDLIDFRTGLPDLRSFPMALWKRLTRDVLDTITPTELAYGDPEGIVELREAISTYLVGRRGLACTPEQVVVVAGTTQAVGLIGQLLVTDGRKHAVVEDPVTSDIRQILASRGAHSVPVPVDEFGLQTELLPRELEPALIYVTPSHQYPLGGILPAPRRAELVAYALSRDSVIVEDDYDTEFRFGGNPVGSIQELAPERVIYVGSFSKTIFPALRLAFIVLPRRLISGARETKWHSDLHNPVIEQKVLARFIRGGHFDRHVQKTRRQLARKHRALCAILAECFGGGVEVLGAAAGLHLAARFRGVEFSDAFLKEAETKGVKLYCATDHAFNGRDWSDTLLFGFGMLDTAQIDKGIRLLAALLGRPT